MRCIGFASGSRLPEASRALLGGFGGRETLCLVDAGGLAGGPYAPIARLVQRQRETWEEESLRM